MYVVYTIDYRLYCSYSYSNSVELLFLYICWLLDISLPCTCKINCKLKSSITITLHSTPSPYTYSLYVDKSTHWVG